MAKTVPQDRARLTRLLTTVHGPKLPRPRAMPTPSSRRSRRSPLCRAATTRSLNAFAFSAAGEPVPFDTIPDKLIFADGIRSALEHMKIADVGPHAVQGHQFGQHAHEHEGGSDVGRVRRRRLPVLGSH